MCYLGLRLAEYNGNFVCLAERRDVGLSAMVLQTQRWLSRRDIYDTILPRPPAGAGFLLRSAYGHFRIRTRTKIRPGFQLLLPQRYDLHF